MTPLRNKSDQRPEEGALAPPKILINNDLPNDKWSSNALKDQVRKEPGILSSHAKNPRSVSYLSFDKNKVQIPKYDLRELLENPPLDDCISSELKKESHKYRERSKW